MRRRRGQARAISGALVAAVLAAGTVEPSPTQAEPVGHARQVVRSVFGTVDAVRRPVVVDGDVFWREQIETGDESASRIVFLDETTLSTGPNSRVVIDEFVYAAGPGGGRVVIELGRGVMRFVSGIQPSSTYSVRTPNAMIGVRGTDFVVIVDDSLRTSVFVRRGAITLAAAGGGELSVGAGRAGKVDAGGHLAPGEPSAPESQEVAAATEITALLAISGEADPAAASEAGDAGALSARKAQAAAARAATAASASGAGCGGC